MQPEKILKGTDTFPFGKYKGEIVNEIYDQDPGYLIWFDAKVDGWAFEDAVQDDLESIRIDVEARNSIKENPYNADAREW